MHKRYWLQKIINISIIYWKMAMFDRFIYALFYNNIFVRAHLFKMEKKLKQPFYSFCGIKFFFIEEYISTLMQMYSLGSAELW